MAAAVKLERCSPSATCSHLYAGAANRLTSRELQRRRTGG
jgi:hypothetical protein